jgi:hypothetical protein
MNATNFLIAEEIAFVIGEDNDLQVLVDTTVEDVAKAVIKFTEIQLLKYSKSPLDILEFINNLKKENI